MPLVFVHGVNTRKNDEYFEAETLRDALFRQYCLTPIAEDPDTADIFNPYWGDHAATFPWNYGFAHDTQPTLESFGAEGAGVLDESLSEADVAPTTEVRDDVVLSVAKRSLADAVNVLWTAASTGPLEKQDAHDLASAADPVERYVTAQGTRVPDWVHKVRNDAQFVERLLDEADVWMKANQIGQAHDAIESFGIRHVLDHLKAGAASAANRAADAAFGRGVEKALPRALRRFSMFFGDVFEYIRQRQSRSLDIANVVLADLREAGKKAAARHERLVCIGHSMGGDILYDLLTDASITDLPDCDLFVTVGSQVGLFEELKMFQSSDRAFPPNPTTKVPATRHPRIKSWINVFDRSDPFGYPAGTIFDAVHDFVFDTKSFALSAHGAYLLQPTFHARLREHVVALGVRWH